MACLDIEAFLEPRCRPAPLCRAARRTCSDSTLQNSAPVSGTTPRHPRQSCTRLVCDSAFLHTASRAESRWVGCEEQRMG
jgi:hypothetical protein